MNMKTQLTCYSFGIGKKRILAANSETIGTIKDVTPCYWLKINTKPARRDMWDGAVYPHMVHFQYEIDGNLFTGKRYWPWRLNTPAQGQAIKVFFDPKAPTRWYVQPK